jgi:hypothetical protein
MRRVNDKSISKQGEPDERRDYRVPELKETFFSDYK